MPLPNVRPTPAELLRWRRLKPVLLLAANATAETPSTQAASVAELNSAVTELIGRLPDLDADWSALLLDAAVAASEGIATPLDHTDHPAEAVLAWREYLRRGGSIRSLGRYLSRGSDRLVKLWTAPEKTVRERMWLADDEPPSRQLTLTAWPGIQRVLAHCEEALGIDLPTSLPSDSPPQQLSDRPYPIPGDRADFVCDVTVPDGAHFDQGEEFVKTWRIRNVGTVPWTGRYLVRLGGAEGPGTHASPARVRLPDTDPGQATDVSVPMRAALLPGTSASTWKMADSSGSLCFPNRYRHGLRCEIVTRGTH